MRAAALALLFAAAPAHDWRIVPGQRAGRVALGMSEAQVHAAIGPPTTSYDARAGLRAEYWTAEHTTRVWFEKGVVVQIAVGSPRFESDDGVSTALPAGEAVKRFPQPPQRYAAEHGVQIDYRDDAARGIALELTRQDFPGEPFHAYAVIVHRPGAPILREPDEHPRKD